MMQNTNEQDYLDLLKNILENGNIKEDRTGIGTKSIFGTKLSFSLKDNVLPLLTTKKMFSKGIIEELLFFIRGETNTKLLEEKGVNIWKGNTSREFLDKKGLHNLKEGEMGPMYGYLWRNFNGVDQLKNAIDLIKNNPDSRRILVSAYDPSLSNKCVLDPCHMFFQFYVEDNSWLSLQWYQRSVDSFLGLPFNIASYALLTHLIAKITGLKAKELIFIGGDTHIYKNHFNQIKEQLNRDVQSNFPTLNIKKEILSLSDLEKLSYLDFEITNYNPQPAIKADMAI